MSYIDPENASRTVYNGSVYGMRKVYKIVTNCVLDEVQSVWGTGEVEKTGRKIKEVHTYHILATTEALARACFADRFPPDRFVIEAVEPMLVIDVEISTVGK